MKEQVQRDAAGGLRVSLSSSFFLPPKSGGQGVDNELPKESLADFLDSRLRGNDKDEGCPYKSLDDFYSRTRLDREAVENLIMVGAFDLLRVPRRQLLWKLGMLVKKPPDAIPLPLPIPGVTLPQMTLKDKVAADYQIQGLSAKHHPMEVFRSELTRDVLTSSDIAAIPSGAKVIVAGCVVCRQMPGTAKAPESIVAALRETARPVASEGCVAACRSAGDATFDEP